MIYPKGKTPLAAHEKAERDYVVMLSDFHEKPVIKFRKILKFQLNIIKISVKPWVMFGSRLNVMA